MKISKTLYKKAIVKLDSIFGIKASSWVNGRTYSIFTFKLKEGDRVYKYELDGMHCDLVLGTVHYHKSRMMVYWDDGILEFVTEDLEIYKLNRLNK